ncbi:MAG: type III-B CRISPR module RAMP protein Cmr6 [Verrucomicrobiota bacterium]
MANAVLNSISPLLRQPGCASWTLYLDKLGFERDGGAEAKTDALKRAKSIYTTQTERLKETLPSTRWLHALEKQHGERYRCVTLSNLSPLILHLGRASVLENVGIYTDRTTGLPSIPGAAVKGVLSTWATWEANQKQDGSFPAADGWQADRARFPAEHADRILGSNSDSGSEHVGEIVFVGAYPKTVPVVGLDIVNPHRDARGNDLQRLTPNVFLCVESGTQWDFLFYTNVSTKDSKDLLDITETWLKDALQQSGLGAKTAAGYGRFGGANTAPPSMATTAKSLTPEEQAQKDATIQRLRQAYGTEAEFKNKILNRLNPGALDQLKGEIETLQKPENSTTLERLKQILASKDYKDIRKRLRDKPWFPKEWLPTP